MSSKVKNIEPEIKLDDQIQIGADSELKTKPEPETPEPEGGDSEDKAGDNPEPEGGDSEDKADDNLEPKKDAPEIAGAELIGGIVLAAPESGSILLFRPRLPLSDLQFKQLQKHVAGEEARTGCKIILMPYSCEVGE